LLEVALGPDGSLTRTSGTGNVRLDVPASSSSAKAIRAQSLEGSGAPGQGLTNATLAGGVEYREDGDGRIASRLVRSRTLSLALAGETVGEARFVGGVTFEEQDFRAASAEARYDPSRGALRLTGVEAGKVPQVSDARATIDARSIDVVLQGRVMKAAGAVKTVLRASPPAAGRNGARLPSLLRQQEAANVSADALDYRGEEGTATYTGNTTLWQGETAIRAEVIVMDQSRGDLQATGNARSSIVFDTGVSIGRASAITYADAMHTLVYSSSKSAVGSAVVQAQVSGPQGDLHGDRIEVRLAEQGGRIEGLEAVTNVSLRRDARLARGSRLTYYAADERYVMSGADARPVSVVEACKETTGKTLTFFGASDRIIVDGNEEIRTQTRNGPGAACAAAPRPR
jgi:lipopolysaccharide export system protein LptA